MSDSTKKSLKTATDERPRRKDRLRIIFSNKPVARITMQATKASTKMAYPARSDIGCSEVASEKIETITKKMKKKEGKREEGVEEEMR